MKTIMCYGDSNTYGLSPEWVRGSAGRHDRFIRWPGRLQKILGDDYYVIEEGLSGRTTVFDDPTSPCRNGLAHLPAALESHSPLDCVIIMLGTNDTRPIFNAGVAEIGMGLGRLVRCVLDPFTYIVGKPPKVLIACPVPMKTGVLNPTDEGGAVAKSKMLATEFHKIADMYGCEFIDLGQVAEASDEDGVHLGAEAHDAIAKAFAEKLKEML